jgi:hypothetical protein
MTENRKQWAAWTITVLLSLAIALFFGVQYPMPEPPEEPLEPVPLAANFTNPVDIEGSSSAAAPALTFEDDTDTGIFRSAADTLNIATAGTERLEIDATSINIVPELQLTGNLSFDGDLEIGGVQTIDLNEFGASSITTDTTTNLMEIYDAAPVISTTGTVALSALNIDLGIGDSVAGTNTVYGLLIDAISADAQNTETAIAIGNGWDRGIDLDGNDLYLDNDQDTYIHESGDDVVDFVAGAAAGDFRIHTGNLRVGDGTGASISMDGDDAYIEGDCEVDGELELDGALDADSTADFAGVVTLASNVENVIAPSVATKTITYTTGAGGTDTLATIADGEVWMILACYANVTTNWDATAGDDATFDVGDENDPDGLLDLDDAELQASDTEGTGGAAGWQGFLSTDTAGAYRTQGHPFLYAPSGTAETIDLAWGATGDDLTAGELTVYLVYVRLQ